MRPIAALAALLLTACHEEPSFDERYEKASEDIRAQAESIDRQLEPKSNADEERLPEMPN